MLTKGQRLNGCRDMLTSSLPNIVQLQQPAWKDTITWVFHANATCVCYR